MISNAFPATQYLSAEVHQAEGVLSVRLGLTVPEAASVLRTISHCAGAPLVDVARQVLIGRTSVE